MGRNKYRRLGGELEAFAVGLANGSSAVEALASARFGLVGNGVKLLGGMKEMEEEAREMGELEEVKARVKVLQEIEGTYMGVDERKVLLSEMARGVVEADHGVLKALEMLNKMEGTYGVSGGKGEGIGDLLSRIKQVKEERRGKIEEEEDGV